MDSSRFVTHTTDTPAERGFQPALGMAALPVPDAAQAELQALRLEVEHLRAMASALMADLSNHWTAVVGILELSQWIDQEVMSRSNQQALQAAVQASAGLLRSGTKAFVRYQRPTSQVQLTRLIEELSDHLASRLPAGARLAYHLDEGLPTVQADELLLAQLVDEFVGNAGEFLAPDSTVRIATSQLAACPPYESGHYLRCYRFTGPALAVTVSWQPLPGRQPTEDSPVATFFSAERLLAINGGLHLDLGLAVHLDDSSPGVRTARLLVPLDRR